MGLDRATFQGKPMLFGSLLVRLRRALAAKTSLK